MSQQLLVWSFPPSFPNRTLQLWGFSNVKAAISDPHVKIPTVRIFQTVILALNHLRAQTMFSQQLHFWFLMSSSQSKFVYFYLLRLKICNFCLCVFVLSKKVHKYFLKYLVVRTLTSPHSQIWLFHGDINWCLHFNPLLPVVWILPSMYQLNTSLQ